MFLMIQVVHAPFVDSPDFSMRYLVEALTRKQCVISKGNHKVRTLRWLPIDF